MNKSDAFDLIALGANVASGDLPPAQTLHHALGAMVQVGFAIRSVSRFFRTPCFPAGAGPDYVNAAVALTAQGDPAQVMARLHAIEADFGRQRVQRWGARSLDLDFLARGDQVLPDRASFAHWRDLPADLQAQAAPDRLVVPHPRLQDRGFVLVPLADIAPGWRHPVLRLTTAEMLAQRPLSEISEITPI